MDKYYQSQRFRELLQRYEEAEQTGNGGFGGWQYTNGIDISGYNYLVVHFKLPSAAKPTLRIYNTTNVNGVLRS